MKNVLIIPLMNALPESRRLAEEYNFGYEFNDFFLPDVLDSAEKTEELAVKYFQSGLPGYCTLHGAFFDVIPFSPDARIREISALRVEQSIAAAKRLGARGVVFHTNYNPFLNTPAYVEKWLDDNEKYWSEVLSVHSDIEIYLENMFDASPEIIGRLSERLCSHGNYGVCLDWAHASLTEVPAVRWAEALGKYVKHIHINDNDLTSDSHLAVGDGKINWNEFYECCEKYMSKASVLIETSSLDNQRRSAEKLRKDKFF